MERFRICHNTSLLQKGGVDVLSQALLVVQIAWALVKLANEILKLLTNLDSAKKRCKKNSRD